MSSETLYILMRNDMHSMNPGKACAQAAHASNAFIDKFENNISEYSNETKLSVAKWQNHTAQGFGTTIVLGVNEDQMTQAIASAKEFFIADVVFDPTYPVRDGQITHLIPVNTCAYLFAPDRNDPYIKMFLGKFDLY